MGINPNTGEVAAASSDNPLGLGSPLPGQWNLYAQTPDSNSHLLLFYLVLHKAQELPF
jgi:hypothetical protein